MRSTSINVYTVYTYDYYVSFTNLKQFGVVFQKSSISLPFKNQPSQHLSTSPLLLLRYSWDYPKHRVQSWYPLSQSRLYDQQCWWYWDLLWHLIATWIGNTYHIPRSCAMVSDHWNSVRWDLLFVPRCIWSMSYALVSVFGFNGNNVFFGDKTIVYSFHLDKNGKTIWTWKQIDQNRWYDTLMPSCRLVHGYIYFLLMFLVLNLLLYLLGHCGFHLGDWVITLIQPFNQQTKKTMPSKISPRCPFCAEMCKALLPFCASVAAKASFIPGPPQSFMISSISATDLPQRKAECTWKAGLLKVYLAPKKSWILKILPLKMTQHVQI